MNNRSMMIVAVIAALALLASSSSTADESQVANFTAQWQEYRTEKNPPPAPHRIGAYLYTKDELVVAVFTYGVVKDQVGNSFYERQALELQYFKANTTITIKKTFPFKDLESRDSFLNPENQPQAPILCGVANGNIYLLLKDLSSITDTSPSKITHTNLRHRLVRFVKTSSDLEMKKPPLELSRTQSTSQGKSPDLVIRGVWEDDAVFVSGKQVFVNRSRTDFDAVEPVVTKNWFEVYNRNLDEVIKRTPPNENMSGRASTRRIDYMFEESLSGPFDEKKEMDKVITRNLSVLVFKYPAPSIFGEGP